MFALSQFRRFSSLVVSRKFLTVLGLAVMGVALAGFSLAANTKNAVVIFTASWCANCRDVVPVVQEIAGQNGLTVQQIDVDSQTAQSQARTFGLTIPTSELPQVYLLNKNNVSLIFDGKRYQYGRADVVRATLLQNLQRDLGPGVSGK